MPTNDNNGRLNETSEVISTTMADSIRLLDDKDKVRQITTTMVDSIRPTQYNFLAPEAIDSDHDLGI